MSDHEGLRALLDMMGMQVWPATPPRFNVPPTASLDAIMLPKGEQTIQLASMHWGYAAGTGGAHRSTLFNARSETVFSKPSFRSSARTQRAIVPVNGYYEWQRDKQHQKSAFHIGHASEPALALAAIYQPKKALAVSAKKRARTGNDTSNKQLSFDLESDHKHDDTADKTPVTMPNICHQPEFDVCMLTTSANQNISHIHHRMPVILDCEQAMRWITEGDEALLKAFIATEKQPALRITSVGQYVNNAANEGPDCLLATN